MWADCREMCVLLCEQTLWPLISFVVESSEVIQRKWRRCSLVKSSSTGRNDNTGVGCCLAQIRREHLNSGGDLVCYMYTQLCLRVLEKKHFLHQIYPMQWVLIIKRKQTFSLYFAIASHSVLMSFSISAFVVFLLWIWIFRFSIKSYFYQVS